jgi:hypothetical protein
MTPSPTLTRESHTARAPFASVRECVAATDEVTRTTETLARSADAFNGTGAYMALAGEGAQLGGEAEFGLALAWR